MVPLWDFANNRIYNTIPNSWQQEILYRISSIIRWSFFPSETFPKI